MTPFLHGCNIVNGGAEIKGFNFNINDVLGEGSFGKVVKGYRVEDKKAVAIKILKRVNNDAENEWKIPEMVNNPFLLKVLAQFESDNKVYVISELSVSDLEKFLHTRGGKLSMENVTIAANHLARGYTALSTVDILHRDIKPANIFVDVFKDGGVRLKLADFGCGKVFSNMKFTCRGTPYYMAPEVYDESFYDYCADIWSLGLVLYECFFGNQHLAFCGRIYGHAQAKVKKIKLALSNNSAFDDLLNRMIQPDYEKRMVPLEFFAHRFHADVSAQTLIK